MALYAYEVPSSTEWSLDSFSPLFSPTHFVEIQQWLTLKMRAMRCYGGELKEFPHPRSEEGIDALARVRGTQSGFEAAEAFSVIFERVAE